jgi:trk system potassium uptake protein TrkA
MRKHIMIIGTGRFGSAVARTLADGGHEVVAIDANEGALRAVMDHVAHAAIADGTDEEALRRLGVANADVVVVAIGTDFEASILATVAARAAGAQRVVAKASGETSARVLSRVGADEVIRPEHDMGVRLAMQIATPSIVDAFKLGKGHEVVEIEVTAANGLTGTLASLRLRNRFHIHVIAVDRGDDELIIAPGPDCELHAGDRIVVIGAIENLDRFENALDR